MKKLVSVLLSLCLVAGGLTFAFAAQDGPETISAQLRPDYAIVIDGAERTFYNVNGQEVQPLLYQGTTYLPVRAIGELMGKNVNWDESSKTVTLSSPRTAGTTTGTPDKDAGVQRVSAQLRPDFTIIIDGNEKSFSDVSGKTVYPVLYQGSTYLPVRAIGQIMGKTVDWNGNTKTVTLSGGSVTDADSFDPANPGKPETPVTPEKGDIGLDKAKEIALNHAGLKSSQVTMIKAKLEYDDGRRVYDIEFYKGNKEYDYEIDASSGTILSYDYDVEDYEGNGSSTQNPGANGKITEAKAKEIALAKVPGATTANIYKFKLDYDDGRAVYEGTIVYNDMEYEFEIDAVSGAIRDWDAESVYDD